MTQRTYDPKNVKVTFMGHEITGFPDGGEIRVDPAIGPDRTFITHRDLTGPISIRLHGTGWLRLPRKTKKRLLGTRSRRRQLAAREERWTERIHALVSRGVEELMRFYAERDASFPTLTADGRVGVRTY